MGNVEAKIKKLLIYGRCVLYSKVILTDWSAATTIKQVESLEDFISIVPIIKAAIPGRLFDSDL